MAVAGWLDGWGIHSSVLGMMMVVVVSSLMVCEIGKIMCVSLCIQYKISYTVYCIYIIFSSRWTVMVIVVIALTDLTLGSIVVTIVAKV